MAQPAPYNRITSFTTVQQQFPTLPLPGDDLDAELNAVKVTLDQVLNNIALIQRDDGAVANRSIGLDQLKPEVTAVFHVPLAWVTGHTYVALDGVWYNGKLYRCLVPHTSTVFATNLAAAYWELVYDFVADVSGLFNGTSTTNLAIGAGSKTFETQVAKAMAPGTVITLASVANPLNYMTGVVTAYGGTTCTFTVTQTGGAGTFNNWTLAISGVPGVQGIQGLQGPSGIFKYDFQTSTVDGDPGDGGFRLNHATPASATFAYIDTIAVGGGDATIWLEFFDDVDTTGDRGILYVEAFDGSAWAAWRVTGAVVVAAGYRKIPIAPLALFGAFTAGKRFAFSFAPAGRSSLADGDKGDITVSGLGGVWTIDNGAVSYAKIQNVSATDKILGRSTAGAGVVEEIACTAAGRALLDDLDAAAQRVTLGLGALAVKGTIATGDIDNSAVTYAKIQNVSATDKLLGRSTAGAGVVEEIACTAAGRALLDDLDAAAQRGTLGLGALAVKGTIATGDIDNGAVSYAKIQNVSATDKLLGRSTAGAGVVEEIACTAAGRALLDDLDAAAQRVTLGLGTAATQSTGTSGANVPLLNAANTWSASQTIAGGASAPLTISSDSAHYVTIATNTNSGNLGIAFNTKDAGGVTQTGYFFANYTTLQFLSPANAALQFGENNGGGGINEAIRCGAGQEVYFPGIGTTASAANAFLNSGSSPVNQILRSTSSLRYKRDVQPMDSAIALKVVREARPIWYRSTAPADRPDWSFFGLGAEDMAAVEPRFVNYGYREEDWEIINPGQENQEKRLKEGAQLVPDGVAYDRLVTALILHNRHLEARISALEAIAAAPPAPKV